VAEYLDRNCCCLHIAIIDSKSICPLVMHVLWQFCGDCYFSSVCDGYITAIVCVTSKSM